MTIQKSFEFTIDTAKERRRINEGFKDNPETQKKLLQLMDLVEAEKWEEAERTLNDEWWDGRDEEQECPRLEFVGLLGSEGIDPWTSYAQLIWYMHNSQIYKVTNKE